MTTKKNNSRRANGTRKRRVQPMTIPEIKRSFDELERGVEEILAAPTTQKQKVKKFQEVWRTIFGRPVDTAAAEAYLAVKARRAPKKTRKAQRGGMAPLDYQMRPGVDGPHGSFLPYVSQGLSFYNTINQDSMFKGCGTEDITPKIPADMGSNKVGGGAAAAAPANILEAFGARTIAATSPPSAAQDFQDAWLGRPTGASPSPDQGTLKYM